MYPLIFTAAGLAFVFLTLAYSPVFDEEFQDALDDYRRFTGSWPRARQTLR
jgi:hypothetical protein